MYFFIRLYRTHETYTLLTKRSSLSNPGEERQRCLCWCSEGAGRGLRYKLLFSGACKGTVKPEREVHTQTMFFFFFFW